MLVSRRALGAAAAAWLCVSASTVRARDEGGVDAVLAGDAASADVRYALRAILHSGDHGGMPFAVVDKKIARLFLFGRRGRLLGSTPVLLGMAQGDHSVPGVGDLPPHRIPVAHRTTPAGRFLTEAGHNLDGDDVVWIDYDAGLAIHRVRPDAAREMRLQRLAAGRPDAQRVSAGCIVVPVDFYERMVQPALGLHRGVVYVLPETRPVREMFDGLVARL